VVRHAGLNPPAGPVDSGWTMARFGLSQELRSSLAQQQVLLPRMLQSIEVLQLPSGELETWLERAAEENEALAFERGSGGRRGTAEDSQRHDAMLQNQPAPEAGLAEQVERQLSLLEVEGELLEWVRLLAGAIDAAGYLSASDEALLALAAEAGLAGGEEALARALCCLRGLEPRGIGARNAIEALLLQLDRDDPEYELLRALLEDFLQDVARNKLPAVARALGLELGELQRLIARLGELDPRPVAQLSARAAPALHPDLVVERDGEGFAVRVEAGGQPAVGIDEGVLELYRDRGQAAELRSYLRDKLDRARWICDAVEQRGETLRRVALLVFDHQRDFLERGPGHLRPLSMGHLAAELGVHVSTVSRAVAGKHVQTPFGILPLRHFFQARSGAEPDRSPGRSRGRARPRAAADEPGGVARAELRELVRDNIAAEDPHRPLPHDEVVAALTARGRGVARRTVAH
jgi:RNA polymerase sigma-54 factor